MTLIKRASNLLLVAATAGAVVGLSAAPAMAATTLTVKVSNGGTYTATASKTILTDKMISVTCTSTSTTPASKTTGTVATGTHKGTSPVKVGTVKTLSFNHCVGPAGTVHSKVQALPYSLQREPKTNSNSQRCWVCI